MSKAGKWGKEPVVYSILPRLLYRKRLAIIKRVLDVHDGQVVGMGFLSCRDLQ